MFSLLASAAEISPHSPVGYTVLAIFAIGMALIIGEAFLHMDKFKPALFMMTGVLVIAYHYWSMDPATCGDKMAHFQEHAMSEFCPLLVFMALMWVIVELLSERKVFVGLNNFLLRKGLRKRGLFWATGALSAVLAPFLNNITTAMIFGKSIQSVSTNPRYTQIAFCNIILASNSGVWFIGTATTLMVYLKGDITITGLLLLIPCSIGGWIASALVLDLFYLRKLDDNCINPVIDAEGIRHGGKSLTVASLLCIILAVGANVWLKVDISFALAGCFGMLMLFVWSQKKMRGVELPLHQQLQKVEWNTLLFFVGIIVGVACLNATGWLSYIGQLFDRLGATGCNVILGVLSGILDNVPVEAAALAAEPKLDKAQWSLNVLMVGIGGSLTVIGSAAGVMCMSLEKSYTFGAHLRFLPAILVNFGVSFLLWHLQFNILKIGG